MRKKKIAAIGVVFALIYAIGCVIRDASAIKEKNERTENNPITWETTSAQGIFHYVQNNKGASVSLPVNRQCVNKNLSYLHITPAQYSLKLNTVNTPWKITVKHQG